MVVFVIGILVGLLLGAALGIVLQRRRNRMGGGFVAARGPVGSAARDPQNPAPPPTPGP